MKRHLKGLLGLVAGLLVTSATVFAQPSNSLTVQSTTGDPGDKRVVVRVLASNVEPVSGIQFNLRDFSEFLTPVEVRAGDRLEGTTFDVDPRITPDSIRVVVVSLSGDSLQPGNGVLLEILYDVSPSAQNGAQIPLTLNDIVVADPSSDEVEGESFGGEFTIVQTPPSILSIDDLTLVFSDTKTTAINLDNPGPESSDRDVLRVEFDLVNLTGGPDIVEDVAIEVTGRAATAGFEVETGEGEGPLHIILSHPDGGTLPEGDGPVINLSLRGVEIGAIEAGFANVKIIDADSVAMPNGPNESGHFTVLSPVKAKDDLVEEGFIFEDTEDNSISVLANDESGGPNPLKVHQVMDAPHGSVEISEDSTFVLYTPDRNFSGRDSLKYVATDGLGLDTAQVVIDVTPVNDAPTLEIVGVEFEPLEYTENDGPVIVSQTIQVYDPDDDEIMSGAVIELGGYVPGEDTLAFVVDPTGTISGQFDAGTGVLRLELEGEATANEYEVVLQSVTYENTSDHPANHDRTISFTTDDGEPLGPVTQVPSNTATRTIEITRTNDAPVAKDDFAVIDEDKIHIVPLLANDTDVDQDALHVAEVLYEGDGIVSIENDGASVSYKPPGDFNGPDTLRYVVSDGNGGLDTASVRITVIPVNDAPVIKAPVTVLTDEDTPLTFSGNNGISIEDVDEQDSEDDITMQVKLQATSTVELGDLTGITIIDGKDSTGFIVFRGTLTEVNDALDGLIYTPTKDVSAPAEGHLSILANDLQGQPDVHDQIIIGIKPVNDAPVITTGELPDANEGVGYSFRIIAGDIEEDDVFFSLEDNAPGWLSIDDETGVIKGTPGANDVGDDIFTVTVTDDPNDDGDDGDGLSSSKEFTITVNPDATKPFFTRSPQVQGVTDIQATVVWSSNEPTTGKAAYGPDRAPNDKPTTGLIVLSSEALTDTVFTDLSRDGRAELRNLTPSTGYSLQVIIADARGNSTSSGVENFITKATPDNVAPVFTEGPALKSRTDKSLTFGWKASEPARATLFLTHADGVALSQPIQISTATFSETDVLTVGNLNPTTEYTGRIELVDATGNGPDKSTGDNNPSNIKGKTLAAPDVSPPILTSGPIIEGLTDTRGNVIYGTNEPATTIVEYGTTQGLGLSLTDSINFVTNHDALLTNLTPATVYFYRVGAVDRSNNRMAFSALRSFKTKQTPDTTAPVFNEGPSVLSTTDRTAIIAWTTNELASFRIKYAVTGTLDTTLITGGDLVLERTITLTDLNPTTKYFYSIRAIDGSGNTSPAQTGEFTTKATPDTQAPRLIGFVNVITRGHDRFSVGWKTNEASDSEGEAGTGRTGNIINATEFDSKSDPVTDHAVAFTNLLPSTLYYYRVFSRDASGNQFVSNIDSVRTRAAPDVTPPAISGILASPGRTSAIIEWTTSERSDSRVVFGADSAAVADGNTSVADEKSDGQPVTAHRIVLTGLTPATRYFYRVQSTDADKNQSALTPRIPKPFRTEEAEDTTPPSITQINSNAGTRAASITWNTDEPSNSVVLFDSKAATSTAPLEDRKEDARRVTRHEVILEDLTPGTTYRFRVQSADAAGNPRTAPTGGAAKTFTTDAEIIDNVAPLITEGPFLGYASDTKAILKWITDEEADERVFYRKVGGTLYEEQVGESGFKTHHNVSVDGLELGTEYEFVVASSDEASNQVFAPDVEVHTKVIVTKVGGQFKITGIAQATIGRFTTLTAPDSQAPVILSGPTITSTDATSVTINWATDELSTSIVNFGAGNTNQQSENGTLVTNHVMTLTNLSPSTVYSYVVSSTDPANNGPSTSTQSVTQTSAQADITPPVISNVNAATTFISSSDGASATITWTTNEGADTKVEFGTTTSLGQTKSISETVISHSATITRLTPGQSYSYRVSSTDASANGPTLSSIQSFTAASNPDTQAPTFSNVSTSGSTHRRIQVAWTTNELATSILVVKKSATDSLTVIDGARLTSHSLAVTDTVFVRPSTAYTFYVESIDASNNLGIDIVRNITTDAGPDVTPPSAPATLTATPGNAEAQLNWAAVTATDLKGYDVFQGITQIASNLSGTSYKVTGLTNGVLVGFTVKAVDNANNASGSSPTATTTPSAGQAPSAPAAAGTFLRGGAAVDTVSLKPILLVGNATPVSGRPTPTYTFAVYSDTGLTALVISTAGIVQGTATNPTNWQVADQTKTDGIVLLDGARYYWRARANDTVTDGDWTSRKTFITSSGKPTAIQLASMAAESDRGVVYITWKTFDSIGLDGFRIYRSPNAGGPFELVSASLIAIAETGEYRFVDEGLPINATYYYQIEAVNANEAPQRFGPISVKVSPPNTYTISQNFPNPFNPVTSIKYELPKAGEVKLVVYNILGQEVVTLIEAHQTAGFHTVQWNGLNVAKQQVASGVYFYRITVQDGSKVEFSTARKMLLLK